MAYYARRPLKFWRQLLLAIWSVNLLAVSFWWAPGRAEAAWEAGQHPLLTYARIDCEPNYASGGKDLITKMVFEGWEKKRIVKETQSEVVKENGRTFVNNGQWFFQDALFFHLEITNSNYHPYYASTNGKDPNRNLYLLEGSKLYRHASGKVSKDQNELSQLDTNVKQSYLITSMLGSDVVKSGPNQEDRFGVRPVWKGSGTYDAFYYLSNADTGDDIEFTVKQLRGGIGSTENLNFEMDDNGKLRWQEFNQLSVGICDPVTKQAIWQNNLVIDLGFLFAINDFYPLLDYKFESSVFKIYDYNRTQVKRENRVAWNESVIRYIPNTRLPEEAIIIKNTGNIRYRLELVRNQNGRYDLWGYVRRKHTGGMGGEWLTNRIANGRVCFAALGDDDGVDVSWREPCPPDVIQFDILNHSNWLLEKISAPSEFDFDVSAGPVGTDWISAGPVGYVWDTAYDFNRLDNGQYELQQEKSYKGVVTNFFSYMYAPIDNSVNYYIYVKVGDKSQLFLEASDGKIRGGTLNANLFLEELGEITAVHPGAVVPGTDQRLAVKANILNNYRVGISRSLATSIDCSYKQTSPQVENISLTYADAYRYRFPTVPNVAMGSAVGKIEGEIVCNYQAGGLAGKAPVSIKVFANCEAEAQRNMLANCAQKSVPPSNCSQIDLENFGNQCVPVYGVAGALPLHGINPVRGITASRGENLIAVMLTRVSSVLVRIAGAMALFTIVLAGFFYVQARGESKHLERAKTLLNGAIAALVVIFLAYLIITAIQGIFYGAETLIK